MIRTLKQAAVTTWRGQPQGTLWGAWAALFAIVTIAVVQVSMCPIATNVPTLLARRLRLTNDAVAATTLLTEKRRTH